MNVVFTALSVAGAAGMLAVRSVSLPEDQVKRAPVLSKVVAAAQIARIEPKQLVPILADLIVEANLQEEDVVGRICAQASLHDDQARPKR